MEGRTRAAFASEPADISRPYKFHLLGPADDGRFVALCYPNALAIYAAIAPRSRRLRKLLGLTSPVPMVCLRLAPVERTTVQYIRAVPVDGDVDLPDLSVRGSNALTSLETLSINSLSEDYVLGTINAFSTCPWATSAIASFASDSL